MANTMILTIRRVISGTTFLKAAAVAAIISVFTLSPSAIQAEQSPMNSMFNLSETAKELFTNKDAQNNTVLQSIGFDNPNERVYTLQLMQGSLQLDGETAAVTGANRDLNGDLALTQYDLQGNKTGFMYLKGFGHGVQMGVESVGEETFLWTEIDSVAEGTSGWGTKIARFPFENGKVLDSKSQEIEKFSLVEGADRTTLNIDPVHGLLTMRYRLNGSFRYGVYDLEEIKQNRFSPLADVPQPSGLGTFQGFASYGRYLYLLDGTAYGSGGSVSPTGNTYITSVDLKTGAIIDRQLIYGGNDLVFREPEGLAIRLSDKNDPQSAQLSIGFASGVTGARKANILYLDNLLQRSPDAPTDVSAIAGDSQAIVNFTTQAGYWDSEIDSYTVTSSPEGVSAVGTGSPITVKGLTNGIEYTFTVTATNSAGISIASSSSEEVTPLSSNADLSGLNLSSGSLDKTFSSDVVSYNVSVPNYVNVITVTAETYDTGASLQINGNSAVSGAVYGPINLIVGSNPIPVEVTAQDGTVKVYTVVVNRTANSSSSSSWSSSEAAIEDKETPEDEQKAIDEQEKPRPSVILEDIFGHWAEASIKQAVIAGIVNGYPNGTFKPEKSVTRAEFTVMLMKMLNPQETEIELTFADKVNIGSWAQKEVMQAVQAGIVRGYEDRTFRPDVELTRAEIAVMIANALHLPIEPAAQTGTGFVDDHAIPEWAKGSVSTIKKLGIVEGKDGNVFAPEAKTTRAEAVKLLMIMLAQMSK
ncbi:S-layer homology domain-containing protein [Paenibacillus sp. GXUN7292]|uniref:phage baseplate protein n=1 Tax=Paenibacillus sp. GXUN7292 TaxID=3422499 RepID=UPI003D7E0EE8